MGCVRRKECPVWVARNQELALSSTIYILRNIGPLGFCLKEEGEGRDLKVFIGNRHSCTCSGFLKERDLCRHICWVILKRFKISKDDPISFQLGLIDREIEGILTRSNKTVETVIQKQSAVSGDPETEKIENKLRKPILPDDVCPICQENFLAKHWPITYCRNGCGNNVHIRCMKIWSDHQIKEFGGAACETVKCPYCRGDFCTLSQLKKEHRNDPTRLMKFRREVSTVVEEIEAEISEKTEETVEIDEKIKQKKRQLALKVMESVPSHMVPQESRLLIDGVQCCLCLKVFQAREFIGRLACRHRFHKNCLINWFSENQPVCPIDHTPVEMKCSEAIKVVTKRYTENAKDELNFLLCGRNMAHEAPLNFKNVKNIKNVNVRPRRNRHLNPIKTNSDIKSKICKSLSADFALIGNKLQ